ncbi:hypothetical protein J437_LFUL019100 [Ladona fulva]|uniref:PiggyBac transposable element-derived protein domain-containing protein n=1 Tax=Ladona fulva TaxID=123851 RepID=A0A8K0PC55_LADFU|nr:hypothetical protein J437_LFUL019100 [Ladona fulva]
MLQSIIRKPDLEFYWSTRPILATSFFGQIMSYCRFVKIRQYLHFCDNEEYDPETHPNSKLNKIWPVYQKLEEKFKKLYMPERDITIDESSPVQGKASESRSGYVWSTIIYTGKGTLFDNEFKDKPMSSQVVMTLMKPLLDKGYCLITDNFYTFPELAEWLISHSSDT